jgi:hypothetical protein
VSDLACLFAVEPAERLARLRSLRVAARILCGTRAAELEAALATAEEHDADLAAALRQLDALPPLDRRRLLATWGPVTWRGSWQ